MTIRTQTEMDRKFIHEARLIAERSDDPKAQVEPRSAVGAVIAVGNDKISESANVLPEVIKDEVSITDPQSNTRYHFIEHAERAAIFKAWMSGKNFKGATIYCTRFPCSDCARAIIQSDIIRIVIPEGFSSERAWKESQKMALHLFRLANVRVRYLKEG